MKGVERALESGASHINFVLTASNSFNKNNVNRSIAESLEEFRGIVLSTNSHLGEIHLIIKT